MSVENGRSVSYAVHNKPVSMSRSGATVTIDYGPNCEWFRRIDVQGGSTTTTHYVGSIEKVWRPGGVIQVKRYLDGELIETIEGSTRTVEYLLTDHCEQYRWRDGIGRDWREICQWGRCICICLRSTC